MMKDHRRCAIDKITILWYTTDVLEENFQNHKNEKLLRNGA